MIKTAGSTSPYLTVSAYNGNLGYISPGAQAGSVRYNTSMNTMEVFDGVVWQNISGHVDVGLSIDATQALDWAKRKMAREAELNALAKDHPTVAAALEAVRKAEEQLDILAILCKEEQ